VKAAELADRILAQADATRAGLIVLGGHHPQRLRETVFGDIGKTLSLAVPCSCQALLARRQTAKQHPRAWRWALRAYSSPENRVHADCRVSPGVSPELWLRKVRGRARSAVSARARPCPLASPQSRQIPA
jgi:hypothetical protein